VLGSGNGSKLMIMIYSLRNNLSQTLESILPEPQASLAQGIILGIRGNIPSSVKNSFALTGTSHLLAISGLHLSIITGLFLSIGRYLFGRRHNIYAWLTLGTIWFYALLTGMHAPVFRAALMLSLFIFAEILGRQRSVTTSLAFAVAIMVGINPQILWDASFQLSLLAMLGLIYIAPLLRSAGRNFINILPGMDGAKAAISGFLIDSLAVTLGVIITVWPVIAHYFGVVSLVSPLATLLTLPALPAIIVTGILAALLGIIIPVAGQITGWFTWLSTSYLLLIVNGLSNTPFSSANTGAIDYKFIIAYYLLLATLVWITTRYEKWKDCMHKVYGLIAKLPARLVISFLLVTSILASLFAFTMPDNNLHVSLLDVGQGDAILIQTPDHQDILIDGGPDTQALNLALGKKLPFWDRRIDLVVLTHIHADHITGLIEVLNRYSVGQVLYPETDSDSPLYIEFLNVIDRKNIKSARAQAGQVIDLGNDEIVIDVLNPQIPPLSGTPSDIDNNGVVLRLNYNDVSFLFTADIFSDAEYELLSESSGLHSTVLKVGHHGSDSSTTGAFLATVSPQIAVVSAGADNRFGHPDGEVIERLENKLGKDNVYRTDINGTIEFITDGERLWVRTER